MRLLNLSIIPAALAATLLTTAALAQEDQSDAPTAPVTSLFERGGTATAVDYEAFDIDAQLSKVLGRYCGSAMADAEEEEAAEREPFTIFTVNPTDCQVTPDLDTAISNAVNAQVTALIDAQTRIIIARAETEAAQAETVAADAIALRDEARIDAGLAVSIEQFDAIKAMVEDQSERLDGFETDLTQLLNLVSGDPAADGDSGLDGEVARLGTALLELQEASFEANNASVIAGQAIVNWCDLNEGVSWCEMLADQFPQLGIASE